MSWHQESIQKIGNYCEEKFGERNVSIDTSDEKRVGGRNSLPEVNNVNTREDNLYFPDIIIKNKEKNITHIIEIVETSPGNPVSVIGVIFAAEISISIMKNENKQDQNINPRLIFVIPDPINTFDIYFCSICQDKKHQKKNKKHLEWMGKNKSDINNIFNESKSEIFFCPICEKNHRKTNPHFSWFESRISQNEEHEQIKKENKWIRLFEKTIDNDRIKLKLDNIECPKFCYETNFEDSI